MLAGVVLLALAGCVDAGRSELELDRTSAALRLRELERAEQALARRPAEELARWSADLDRRLPDGPRGALTATIAAILSGVPGVEVDGSAPSVAHGQVSTEPVWVVMPGGVGEVAQLLERLRAVGRPITLDRIARAGPGAVEVALHGYFFQLAQGETSTTSRPLPAHDERAGAPAREEGEGRAEIRELLRAVAAVERRLAERGVTAATLARLRRAELKESVLAELEDTSRRADKDLDLVLRALRDMHETPLELTFSVRMGRRLCTVRSDTAEARADLIAVAGSRYGAVTDASRGELVLPSGRVCTLAIGPGLR